MGDENTQVNQQQQEAPEAPSVSLETLQAQLQEIKDENNEYKKLLLSDDFVNFVASKAAGRTRQEETQEPRSGETDFENMSKKDLVQYILTAIDGRINKAVQPVTQNTAVIQAQQQVKEASGKYPDYWEYKDAMIDIAAKVPGLGAEDCYHLAKGRMGGKPPAKPAFRSEVPTNSNARKDEKPAKGLAPAFEKAWKQTFGNATQAS